MLTETLGVEKTRAAVGADGKIVQTIEPIIVALARHRGILQSQVAHMPDCGMYAPPAKSNEPERGEFGAR